MNFSDEYYSPYFKINFFRQHVSTNGGKTLHRNKLIDVDGFHQHKEYLQLTYTSIKILATKALNLQNYLRQVPIL